VFQCVGYAACFTGHGKQLACGLHTKRAVTSTFQRGWWRYVD
jgi:hypothetical protein